MGRGRGGGGAPLMGGGKRKRGLTACCEWLKGCMLLCEDSLISSLPFCFSLWFFQHNTVIAIPNMVMVITHSTARKVVVVIQTPEEV